MMRRSTPVQNRRSNPARAQRQGMPPKPVPRQAMAAQAGGKAAMPNPQRRMNQSPVQRPMNRGARQEVGMQDSRRRPAPAPRRPMS